jgi:thiol-disulfide isomerase/thioredoxin
MDKILKIGIAIVAIVVIVCTAVFSGVFSNGNVSTPSIASGSGAANLTVYFFYGAECPHCHNVMPFMETLAQKYPDVTFMNLEVWHNQTNADLMDRMNTELNITDAGVPEVIIGSRVLIGDQDIPAQLEGIIQNEIKKKG